MVYTVKWEAPRPPQRTWKVMEVARSRGRETGTMTSRLGARGHTTKDSSCSEEPG